MGKGISSSKTKKKKPKQHGEETLETLKAAVKGDVKRPPAMSSRSIETDSGVKPPELEGAEALKISNKIEICKQTGCHDIMTTFGFCRFHYLVSWKRLKTKEAKRKGQELEVFLKDLTRKFPEDFLEKLRVEIEEMSEKEASSDSDDEKSGGGLFDSMEGDDDLDTIISGLKVEDF